MKTQELLCEIKSCCAAVEEDGLAGLDELAGSAGDGALRVGAIFGALVEGVGARGGIFVADPDDAAVGAVDEAFLFEDFHIAADGGVGDAQFAREGVEIADAAAGEEFLQARLTFGNQHELICCCCWSG